MTIFEKKVKQLAIDTNRSNKAATHLVINSGAEYLEILAVNIKDWRHMQLQFGALIRDEIASKQTITQWFDTISKSPVFWAWWAGELHGRLVLGNDYSFIPQRVLRDIFGIEHPLAQPLTTHVNCKCEYLLDTNLISKHK